jgi:hypothetical protein
LRISRERVFQQPQAISLIENWADRVSECYGDVSPTDWARNCRHMRGHIVLCNSVKGEAATAQA